MPNYWIKDVTNKEKIAYEEFNEGEIFNLHWPNGAGKRSDTIPFGDYILLKQRQHFTHLVKMIDSSTSNDLNRKDFTLYREVYCIKKFNNLAVQSVLGKNHADRGLGSSLNLKNYSISMTDLLKKLDISTSDLLQTDQYSDYSIINFPEGRIKYRIHRIIERNSTLTKVKKEHVLNKYRTISCEVCGFNFNEKYGEVGENYIEAHHLIPISYTSGIHNATIDDLILVCSNCHTMIHKLKPYSVTLKEIKDKLNIKKTT